MWWLWLGLALAGTKADARSALDAGRFAEAAGLYRLELLQHPGRGWALRGLTHAVHAQARVHLSDAERLVADGLVEPGLAAADKAVTVLARGAKEGADVDPRDAEAVRERLVTEAAAGARDRGAAALKAGRFQEAVDALSVARALVPDDGEALAGAHRAWSAWLGARGERVAAAEQLEASVALTGSSDDRAAAARLYAQAGADAVASGDCVAAMAPLRRAAHLDPQWSDELDDATACATIDVVLEVRGGHIGEATAALRQRIAEVLEDRGRRHVKVVTRSDRPTLTLRVGLLTAETVKGEMRSERTRRPGPGASSKIILVQSMPVTTTWTGRLVVLRGDEVVHETQLSNKAVSTARWDGKVVAVEMLGTQSKRPNAKPSGNKAPTVAKAVAESEAAVVRALASSIVTELLTQLDATPPPEVPPEPVPSQPGSLPPPSGEGRP